MKNTFLLVDISNTFTKWTLSDGARIGRVRSLPTSLLTTASFRHAIDARAFKATVVSSVVPLKNTAVRRAVKGDILFLSADVSQGIGIDYPNPQSIGADRLANAIACVEIYGAPAIVVDFGTAVTFDVVSPDGSYVGGVIAPGLNALTEYLHSRTALLPHIALREPLRVVGKSTEEAMLSGAVYGYRGLVKEILMQVRRESFPRRRPRIVATGGDAALIAQGAKLFDIVDPTLTLHGLRVVASRTFAPEPSQAGHPARTESCAVQRQIGREASSNRIQNLSLGS